MKKLIFYFNWVPILLANTTNAQNMDEINRVIDSTYSSSQFLAIF
ncbi:MAG: hypothetical protein WBB21_08965 [Saprospiraceae bacterium]